MAEQGHYNTWKALGYNWIPIISEIMGDLDTPLSLYFKLAKIPYSYLLESGFDGKHWGRYSIVGLRARTRIIINEHLITYIKNDQIVEQITVDNPLDYIAAILNSYHVPPIESPLRFLGGLVGYFGYDTVRYIEKRLNNFSQQDGLKIPDIYLMLSEELLVHDSLTNKIYIIIYINPTEGNTYEQACQKIKQIKERLKEAHINLPSTKKASRCEFESNISQLEYEKKVKVARQFFEAGDVMQLILSQRFTKSFRNDPLNFYRILKQLNPSPYMYFIDLGEFQIVGASPEILVRLEKGHVTVRPLAGTRRRGKTPSEDLALEKELLSDPKELAEHLMLIDLGRNDIGRVCKIGTVNVTEQMAIERFSHVMHISSTVEGEIKPHFSALDLLKATFPAGTVSGAPKVRAMEIIDQLEKDKRGLYGGAIGYLGWNGNMDMAIALRTALIKDQKIHIQTGAGLVADSKPTREWQECLNKGSALFLAAQMAETNFLESAHDFNN
jgi:anthranilate synthase component 1